MPIQWGLASKGPDFSQSLNSIVNSGQQIGQRRRETANKQAIAGYQADLTDGDTTEDQRTQLLSKIAAINPQMAQVTQGLLSSQDERAKAKGVEQLGVLRGAYEGIANTLDGSEQTAAINAASRRLIQMDGDPADLIEMLSMKPEERVAKARGLAIASGASQQLFDNDKATRELAQKDRGLDINQQTANTGTYNAKTGRFSAESTALNQARTAANARANTSLARQKFEEDKRRYENPKAGMGPDGKPLRPTADRQNYEYWKQLKETDPEGARAFAQSTDLLPKDKKLTAAAESELITSQNSYYSLSEQGREYSVLADDFQRYADELPSGANYSVQEFFKNVTGSQDGATEIRRRLSKVRLGEGLKALPPGPATDRDVREAFKGVPKVSASPEQVRSFLRGSAKLANVEAEFQRRKSEYISENNGTQGFIKSWEKAIEAGEIESVNSLRQPDAALSDDDLVNMYAP